MCHNSYVIQFIIYSAIFKILPDFRYECVCFFVRDKQRYKQQYIKFTRTFQIGFEEAVINLQIIILF